MTINYILYISAHLIMPDTLGDTLYGFPGFMEYGKVSGDIVVVFSEILFIVNVVLLIVQLKMSRSIKNVV